MNPENAIPVPPAKAEVPPVAVPRPVTRRNADTLGLAWLNGSLDIAVFHRNAMQRSWSSPDPVLTIPQFEAALDTALATLDFGGAEVFLLLENEKFVHQTEAAPAFSESAARHYLQGRVRRYEQERGATLWVSQQTVPLKQEHAHLLHLLPNSFYDEINQILLARRLDLTRIVPLVVPVQRELNRFPIAKGRPVLVAVEAGNATIVLVATVGGTLAFARTILATWAGDPGRIGLEINRSLLYAKQQFGLTVERIWLLGHNRDSMEAVAAKCGTAKQVTQAPTQAVEWLQSTAKLSPQQPVNLVAGYLRAKRRIRMIRHTLLAAAWLGVALLGVDSWTRAQAWKAESRQLEILRERAPALAAERDHLAARNKEVERDRRFIHEVEDNRLPDVPGKFLAYVAGILPDEMRLTEVSVKWDNTSDSWAFRLDGAVNADEDTSRELIAALQRQLTKSPLRARFNDSARAVVSVPSATNAGAPDTQRFGVEGVMLEN